MARRLLARAVLAVSLAAAVCAATAPPAPADGDPASDVLAYQPVYFPYQPAPSAAKRELNGLVGSADRHGYPIRVAVIQSRRDLGSLPMLFERPAVYARFLSAELGTIWHGRVLIVTPSGYGIAQGARLVHRGGVDHLVGSSRTGPDQSVLRRLPPPRGSTPAALVAAASGALRALAAQHDIALTAAPPDGDASGGGSDRNTRLAAAVAAVVGLTAGLLWFLWRTRPRRPTS